MKFLPIDEKEFEERYVDISGIYDAEGIVEKINEIDFPNDRYIKIILTGNREVEIEAFNILRYLENPNIIKLKDKTKLEIDLEKIANQNNLRGIFIRKLLERKSAETENKEKIEKAIEIGLEAFM